MHLFKAFIAWQVFVISAFSLFVWIFGIWPLNDSYALSLNNWDWLCASCENFIEHFVDGLIIWLLLVLPIWLMLRRKSSQKIHFNFMVLLWPLFFIFMISFINSIRFFIVKPYI
jgi:hypothetical protein